MRHKLSTRFCAIFSFILTTRRPTNESAVSADSVCTYSDSDIVQQQSVYCRFRAIKQYQCVGDPSNLGRVSTQVFTVGSGTSGNINVWGPHNLGGVDGYTLPPHPCQVHVD